MECVRDPFLIIDEFLPTNVANDLRGKLEDHFNYPERHQADTHQIWNYWFIDGLYTYHRTLPHKVFGHDLANQFQSAVEAWAKQQLGMTRLPPPYLSMYIDGCRQGQHNDSGNGRFAYVYSLTKNERKTIGGQTLVWREENYFAAKFTSPHAGNGFYEAIEPRFNRLAVFDDRMPHAVERVEGPMDPLEGRFVLHGHISEEGPIVDGPLLYDAVTCVLTNSPPLTAEVYSYHGPLVLRLQVNSDGRVTEASELVNRLKPLSSSAPPVGEEVNRIIARARQLRFTSSSAASIVTIPLSFGQKLF